MPCMQIGALFVKRLAPLPRQLNASLQHDAISGRAGDRGGSVDAERVGERC